jgi:hypothetical protein
VFSFLAAIRMDNLARVQLSTDHKRQIIFHASSRLWKSNLPDTAWSFWGIITPLFSGS